MTIDEPAWTDDDWDPTIYRYTQIADWVEERIRNGVWPARTVLSEMALQAYFGVGRGTIRRAMEILRERKMISTLPGKGSAVIWANGDLLD
jgi:DNA-binding GntR family transcriptional regulator